jgi:hypothetical protein
MMVAQGYFFSASVAFVSVLTEIIMLILVVIPYSPGEIFLELIICTWNKYWNPQPHGDCTGRLGLLEEAVAILTPTPDTLVGVISYICGSRILVDFEWCEGLGIRTIGEKDCSCEKDSFGKYVGFDGKSRWMIEEITVLLASG